MLSTVVIMAAGMGSRFGGCKQLALVGPSQSTLLEYSLYDALQTGFNRAVIITREELLPQLQQQLAPLSSFFELEFVIQRLNDIPQKFSKEVQSRKKPWGTAHAVYSAREVLNESFVVINADDFYGRAAWAAISLFAQNNPKETAFVAYQLKNTLSSEGTVSRGVCELKGQNLSHIQEYTQIQKTSEGHTIDRMSGKIFTGKESVSMNFWCFQPEILSFLKSELDNFLATKNLEKEEFTLPAVVMSGLQTGLFSVKAVLSDAKWQGMTYAADRANLDDFLAEETRLGHYPAMLWK